MKTTFLLREPWIVRCCIALLAACFQCLLLRDAHACGGCFSPAIPTSMPQVVQGHRMVFALSATQTTLWDQFDYAGEPEEFVWVLPLANAAGVRIGLAEQSFMDALDRLSAPVVTSQLPDCFGPLVPRFDAGFFGCGPGSGGSPWVPGLGSDSTRIGADGQAVVGPYAITVIGSHMGGGQLDTWLRDNGFAIPSSVRSVIERYVQLEFDFLILRLRPGAGVRQMQPVRITVRGYSPVLPLRMIAAGAGDKVTLNLMVVAESRMQARDFLEETIAEDELTYDAQRQTSNWREIYGRALRRNGGRVWISESVQPVEEWSLSYRSRELPSSTEMLLPDGGTDGSPPFFSMDVLEASMQLPDALLPDAVESDAYDDVFDTGVQDESLQETGPQFDFEAGIMRNDGSVTAMMPEGGLLTRPYVDRRELFAGMGTEAVGRRRAVLTRLRTDLSLANLSRDLVLDPSRGGMRAPSYRAVLLNGPACPRFSSGVCTVVGSTAPVALEALAIAALVLRTRSTRRRAAKEKEQ